MKQLLQLFNRSCKTCEAHQHHIVYLQKQIEELKADWRNEREEFKRAIDRMLSKEGIREVGQGVSQVTQSIPINPFQIFEEKEDRATI